MFQIHAMAIFSSFFVPGNSKVTYITCLTRSVTVPHKWLYPEQVTSWSMEHLTVIPMAPQYESKVTYILHFLIRVGVASYYGVTHIIPSGFP